MAVRFSFEGVPFHAEQLMRTQVINNGNPNDFGHADEDCRERAKPVKGEEDAEQRQSAEAGNNLRLVPAIAIAPQNQHRAI